MYILKLILHWIVAAIAIMLVALFIPGIAVSGFGSALIVALVLGLLNILFRPILIILTLPINILTLGLFTFIIDALLILLAGKITPGFYVSGFLSALLFGIILAIVNVIFSAVEKEIAQS